MWNAPTGMCNARGMHLMDISTYMGNVVKSVSSTEKDTETQNYSNRSERYK